MREGGLDVETRAPSLTSTTCAANGAIGSIVIVPNGEDDQTIEVRVVGGVTRAPDTCATYNYDGCIVARRTIAFIPHQSLSVDVDLQGACIGDACDPLTTCVDGVCQDARVTSTTPEDAGPTGPTVRCGDNGVVCGTTGEVCCLSVADGGTQGSCRLPANCPPTSIVLACDDETDCAGPADDAGFPPQCCVTYTTAPAANTYSANAVQLAQCLSLPQCVSYNGGLGLCQHRQGCDHGTIQCEGANAALPGYFWCDLPGVVNAKGGGP